MESLSPVSKSPRYRQVADELSAAILGGRYPVNSLLPTEKELCRHYAISRHTAREALRLLEIAGLISRRQGAGSLVIADTPPDRYNQFAQSVEDLLQYGNATRFHIERAESIAADTLAASLLGIAPGTACVRLYGIRRPRHDRRPLAVTEVYLPEPEPAARSALLDLGQSIYRLLDILDLAKLGSVEQNFTAVCADPERATALGMAPGAAALRTVRRYFDRQGELLAAAVSLHPGESFSYSTVLRRA
ncbi:GntR family transcriptional regulator [Chitinimonas lacunae]|uniref:GntR family transcriptional regulator n=1 Tax=Chitinimonas lacunae TaxID=1963018 RepID=A0ABV8MVG7_9NEIS